ncbi:hypothetical protein F5Y06DRAFT_286980 [Hypoxylon sp. FL0890]|nr:hypothetical protein F5Y06DRAFT_286980 [Hypoxylon sp. FL0890]
MTRFQDLERAACDVIQHVKQIQDLRHTRLSVIGGLALWHYLPEYRTTDNVNFITNISTSPSSLKKRLLEQPNSPFFQRSQALFYKGQDGKEIRIDISPEWLSPYLPESAMKVQDISQDEIPYISLIDLIVFKLDSSGLRSNPAKKERDARDAAALVDLAANKAPIRLSKKQEQVVEEALCDVATCGTKEKGWWEKHMSLEKTFTGRQKQTRPHSNSEPSPSQSPMASDPNEAWHYERLDHTHIRRFNSLHRSWSTSAGRPRVARSASQRTIRDTGFTMTQPKTTHASFQNGAKQSGVSNEISHESHYHEHDGLYYALEPPGCSLETGAKVRGGYFDLPPTPPGGLGTVTEHPIGARRSSMAGYFDITPGASPSTEAGPMRSPGLEKRSVTFLL